MRECACHLLVRVSTYGRERPVLGLTSPPIPIAETTKCKQRKGAFPHSQTSLIIKEGLIFRAPHGAKTLTGSSFFVAPWDMRAHSMLIQPELGKSQGLQKLSHPLLPPGDLCSHPLCHR